MQQSGSQYGVSPEMASYAGSQGHILDQLQQQQQQLQHGDAATVVLAEAASPISSRPPAQANFDELVAGAGGFHDEDALVGDDAERGATAGNRWPRQETLVLLKIRSDMDAAFKEATLKGPLWEDVSRKLAELGYHRSAKKCKEKFENVHKYYKRTKEGRAGRQDSKNYRFSSQLEALHSRNSSASNTVTAFTTTPAVPISVVMGGDNPMVGSSTGIFQSPPIFPAPALAASQRPDLTTTIPATGVISFSSNNSSSSGEEEEEEEEKEKIEEGLQNKDTRKRKRTQLVGGCNKKMEDFLERLMKEVMEKQEGMLQKFIETIEKREQDRMIREEAWRRQEMARLTREQEIMAHERAISASRDAAVIAFLQQITGQTVQIITQVPIPSPIPPPQPPNPPPPPPQLQPQQQQQQQYQEEHQQQQSQVTQAIHHQAHAQSSELVLVQQQLPETTGVSIDLTSPRWPKAEVLALIKLRTRLEVKYQETGPKGPLWEDISMRMKQFGYQRSAKRCKEKWENINKYFKKVKESNKKRPEDAKTCPYFHELDALYRNKLQRGGATDALGTKQEQEVNQDSSTNTQETRNALAILPPPESQTTVEINTNNNKSGEDLGIGGSSVQIQTSNRGLQPSFFEEGLMKKPEDTVKELMGGDQHDHHNHNKHHHHHHHSQQEEAVMEDYNKLDDSDNLDEDDEDDIEDDDDEDDDEKDEDKKMAYEIQCQRPNPGPSDVQGNPTGSFLAVVQQLSSQ